MDKNRPGEPDGLAQTSLAVSPCLVWIGTLPRSLIRLRLAPGAHQLAFEWNERVHGFAVDGAAGDLRIVELAGSSVPLDRPYHWSDADPAGAKLRARTTRLVADAHWTSSAPR